MLERIQWRLKYYREKFVIFVAKRLPRDVKKWVVVLATVEAAGVDKNACDMKYLDIYNAI